MEGTSAGKKGGGKMGKRVHEEGGKVMGVVRRRSGVREGGKSRIMREGGGGIEE